MADNQSLVERVSAPFGLAKDFGKVSPNHCHRIPHCAESIQLRMARVPAGPSAQDLLCQQAFPPHGQQAFHVELRWVQRPESHRKQGLSPRDRSFWKITGLTLRGREDMRQRNGVTDRVLSS
jgi:hypothetical protein